MLVNANAGIAMPLLIAMKNVPLKVVAIKGDEKVAHHLNSLGICRGQVIEISSNTPEGVILKVLESRIAINKEAAKRIEVVPA